MMAEQLPIKLSKTYVIACLLGIGILFYATYGGSNYFASMQTDVPEIYFDWELAIPFWDWSIIPYWSLNCFYALAFFLCRDKSQLHHLIKQLITAQACAILCFIIYPLVFTWEKPISTGLTGGLFTALAGFDQPYNQAPSLHIMLTLIIGRFYWYRIAGYLRYFWLLWLLIIGLSVLTTYQHHFIDIPLGLLAGAIVLWLLPMYGNDAYVFADTHLPVNSISKAHKKWLLFYAVMGLICLLMVSINSYCYWFFWPVISCGLLALCYLYFGASGLQKQKNGQLSIASLLLLLPYLPFVRLNMLLWLRHQAKHVKISEELYLGSILSARHFDNVVDVCAEYPLRDAVKNYTSVPLLDMVEPEVAQLKQAACAIENYINHQQTPVLVCCALGYSRSVAVLITYLIRSGNKPTISEAIDYLKQYRPQLVLSPATIAKIERACDD